MVHAWSWGVVGLLWVVSVCVARTSEMGGGGSVGGLWGERIAVVSAVIVDDELCLGTCRGREVDWGWLDVTGV